MKRSYSEFEQEMEQARYRIEELNIHPHKKRICISDDLIFNNSQYHYNHLTPIMEESILDTRNQSFVNDIEMLPMEQVSQTELNDEDLEVGPTISIPYILQSDAEIQQESLLKKYKLNPESSQLILYQPKVESRNFSIDGKPKEVLDDQEMQQD